MEGYSGWAKTYDTTWNTLIAIEELYSLRLLDGVGGGNALDVGAGSGRFALKLAGHLASPWLPDNLAQKFQWHTLFTHTIEAASSIARRDICPDLFNTYLILGSR